MTAIILKKDSYIEKRSLFWKYMIFQKKIAVEKTPSHNVLRWPWTMTQQTNLMVFGVDRDDNHDLDFQPWPQI